MNERDNTPAPQTRLPALSADQLCQTPFIEDLVPTNEEWEACEVIKDRYELMKRRVRLSFTRVSSPLEVPTIDIVPLLRNYPHEEMQFEKSLMTAAADEIERLRVTHPRQTIEEIVENCLRIWFFNYEETADHSGHRIAMHWIVDFVLSQSGEHADQTLVDKYRDPKTGNFDFPGDVAKIIRKFEGEAEKYRENVATLVDDMLKEPGWASHPRSRLALTVAARTIRRGRSLGSMEKWENIKAFCEEHGDD